jgi:hypothetical protein
LLTLATSGLDHRRIAALPRRRIDASPHAPSTDRRIAACPVDGSTHRRIAPSTDRRIAALPRRRIDASPHCPVDMSLIERVFERERDASSHVVVEGSWWRVLVIESEDRGFRSSWYERRR